MFSPLTSSALSLLSLSKSMSALSIWYFDIFLNQIESSYFFDARDTLDIATLPASYWLAPIFDVLLDLNVVDLFAFLGVNNLGSKFLPSKTFFYNVILFSSTIFYLISSYSLSFLNLVTRSRYVKLA